MANKERQISMLFREEGFITQMEQMAGRKFNGYEDLKKEVIFTKQDIVDYIKRHHLQDKIFSQTPSTNVGMQDGMYLIKEGEKFVLYMQEHGTRNDERTFDSLVEANEYVRGPINSEAALLSYVDRRFGMYCKE